MSKYFEQMVSVAQALRFFYKNYQSVQDRSSQQPPLFTCPDDIQQTLSKIISIIMNKICNQILRKMKQLGVIVREPLIRSASCDNYTQCYENFNKKFGQNSVYGAGNPFNYSCVFDVFTTQCNLRNL